MLMKYHRKPPNGAPLLVGYTTPYTENRSPKQEVDVDEIIHVWCPYCRRYHEHGWEKSMPSWAIESRVPHCDDESPLRGNDYWIGREPKRPTSH